MSSGRFPAPLRLHLEASNQDSHSDSAVIAIEADNKTMPLLVQAFYDGAIEIAIVDVIDRYLEREVQ